MTAADYLSILQDSAQVGTYKDLMLSLGKLTHEVRAHQSVLQGLGRDYEASLEDTDFKALLDQGLKDRLERQPYQSRDDKRLKDFLQVAAGAGGNADQGGGGEEELGEEEDLAIVDEGQAKCPLSMKPVLELERPVKDHMGYVYEHTSIMDYLRGHPDGHKHPVAGVYGKIRAGDLKPAEDVVRAQRRRRLQEAIGHGPVGGSVGEEEIIDV